MEEKKYVLTNETKQLKNGVILHRIQAVINLAGSVSEGDLGGWIEKEENLSHEGTCWVYDDAMVYGDAVVHDYAKVFDKAQVFGEAGVFDHAVVCDEAKLFGNVRACDHVKIWGRAIVSSEDYEVIGGASRVCDILHIGPVGPHYV